MEILKEADTTGIWELLSSIPDPEIPVISIVDLGVVRKVEEMQGKVVVTITPTYSGCPALKTIEENIREAFQKREIENVEIKTVLYPPWTTDWIPDSAREKLRSYGIAPPEISTESHLKSVLSGKKNKVTCPFCHSKDTTLTSAFGSTACKALHYCN